MKKIKEEEEETTSRVFLLFFLSESFLVVLGDFTVQVFSFSKERKRERERERRQRLLFFLAFFSLTHHVVVAAAVELVPRGWRDAAPPRSPASAARRLEAAAACRCSSSRRSCRSRSRRSRSVLAVPLLRQFPRRRGDAVPLRQQRVRVRRRMQALCPRQRRQWHRVPRRGHRRQRRQRRRRRASAGVTGFPRRERERDVVRGDDAPDARRLREGVSVGEGVGDVAVEEVEELRDDRGLVLEGALVFSSWNFFWGGGGGGGGQG